MSKTLERLLGPIRLEELGKHGITVVTRYSSINTHIPVHDYVIKLSQNYRKPTNSEDAINKFVDTKIKDAQKNYKSIDKFIFDKSMKYELLEEETIIKTVVDITNENRAWNTFVRREIDSILEMECIEKETNIYKGISDYPDVFPMARKRNRKIVAYLGPTNSGKTWQAFEDTKNKESIAYLAPLRLLALENFEYMKSLGHAVSLITGEERINGADASCVSSTVECFNPTQHYNVVIIDEIQMIDDKDRSAFFIQALVGANADEIIVTGPLEYLDTIKEIADYLGDEFEYKEFKRKAGLEKINRPVSLSEVKKNTAIIAFSKRAVYEIKDSLPKHLSSTVLYGALGHEVRKTQAERFANGEVDVIVTTDCIGMGLNLPIETVLFSKHQKYDGYKVGDLSVMLTKQIAGRAGRYGKYTTGYYGALNRGTLKFVDNSMKSNIEPWDGLYSVLPPNSYITNLIDTYSLSTILKNWSRSTKFPENSIFCPDSMSGALDIAYFLESLFPTQYKEWWTLIFCPIDIDRDYVARDIIKQLIVNRHIETPDIDNIHSLDSNTLEHLLREMSIYLWFVHKYPDFVDTNALEIIQDTVYALNKALNVKLGIKRSKKQNRAMRRKHRTH